MDKTTRASITSTLTAISESNYLINANRKKCQEIFSKKEWNPSDELIDGYIALHIVMEAGLNSLFRQLVLRGITKDINHIDVMKNVDEISFIHKTTLFIYNSKFDFTNDMADASKYHKIIGTLKKFSRIRNSLLHGAAIATISGTGIDEPIDTELRKDIKSGKRVLAQLNRFRFIMDGMTFYIDHLEGLSDRDKEFFNDNYLGYDFLPKDWV